MSFGLAVVVAGGYCIFVTFRIWMVKKAAYKNRYDKGEKLT